jgi:glycosyltransferase involved in cell wall biosynthesis
VPTDTTLTVVVPTRHEKDNVAAVVERLDRALGGTAAEVLFVDDSDDDTPQVINSLVARYSGTSTTVRLLHRSPGERGDGLSGAVLLGFASARSPWIAVMDSDLQHPPEVVPEMLRTAQSTAADLVVGSRYTGGGDAGGLSGIVRHVASRGSGAVVRTLFPRRLRGITDPMSGLFLIRRDALDAGSFRPLGFKILLEIAVRTRGLRVVEVPYTFAERRAGESKASLREGIRFARHLVRLRLAGAFGRALGVGVIGLTGIAINTAALWAFVGILGLGLTLGAVLSTQVSTTWNSLLALTLIYRGRSRRAWAMAFLAMALVNNLALLLRIPALHALVSWTQLDYRVANVVTLLMVFAARFVVVDRSLNPRKEPMTKTAEAPVMRKPAWLDYHYEIRGVVRIGSQIELPELEHFRVPASPSPAGIEIRIGEVGRMRARAHVTCGDGMTTYEEHLGSHGSSFCVEFGDPMYVTVAPMLAKSPHVVYTNIVEALLRFTAVAKGKMLLHSACLAIDGVGVMLSARTDTGKTGTVLRLLREHGAQFLSDDMTILEADGTARSFPKPLTISQHTLRAVQADDLTPKEWRRLRLQSRLHSKEGRGIGLMLARANLPIMLMNALTQRLVPPPKYSAGRLVPCWTINKVRVRDMFIIQRSEPVTETMALNEAVTELLENTDDAYGFPPFAAFAPTIVIDGLGWDELRAKEEEILRSALSSGVRVRRLGSDSFDWADRIPGLIADQQPHASRQPHPHGLFPQQRGAVAQAG